MQSAFMFRKEYVHQYLLPAIALHRQPDLRLERARRQLVDAHMPLQGCVEMRLQCGFRSVGVAGFASLKNNHVFTQGAQGDGGA